MAGFNNYLGKIDCDGLRQWLTEHHDTEKECWVIIKRGKPCTDTLWYVDAVCEALCFGWIDSTLRKLPSGENAQMLMPRSRSSHWSELNKARLRRMELLGLVTDAGRNIAPVPAPFRIDEDILYALQADADAWEIFLKFPTLYQRIRIDNIQSYRSDKKLFQDRLDKLVLTAKAGKQYGQWDDYGRLGGAHAHDYFLKTERIGFSYWSEIDLTDARTLWGNSEVTKYICASGRYSEDEICARLSSEINFYKVNGVQYWPIYKLDNGDLIGCCGLHPHGEEYELGFHLRPEYWRQGYATEAAGAVIEYAFREKKVESIFAGHNPQNIASKGVLEKLGFDYTGVEFYEPTGLYHPSYQLKRSNAVQRQATTMDRFSRTNSKS